MAEPAPAVRVEPAGDGEVARAIRFAVYLTGGLVVLAFGIADVASSLGQILDCVYQTTFCSGGFSSGFELEVVPELGAGAFLVGVAVVLFVLARRSR